MNLITMKTIKNEEELRNQLMVVDAITMINWSRTTGLTEYSLGGYGHLVCPYLVDTLEDIYWPKLPLRYRRNKRGQLEVQGKEIETVMSQKTDLTKKLMRDNDITPDKQKAWISEEPDFKIEGSFHARTKCPRMDYEINLETNRLQKDLYRLVMKAVPLNADPAIRMIRAIRGQPPLNQVINRICIKPHTWTARMVWELVSYRLFINKLGWPQSLSLDLYGL